MDRLRFVNVVPRQRILDALRLMKQPLDTTLNRSLAREICLRDGEIRAFLTGRVEKLGKDYVFWAEIVDPVRDATIATWSEASDDGERFWPVLHRLTRSVRTGLGESIRQIRQSDRKMEAVTTPSLAALGLFSEADALLHERIHGAAAELLERALSEDPNFAAAHMWLAWALRNDGLPEEKWLPHVEESVRLSAGVSEPERLVILAKAHTIRGEHEEAVPLYEALLRLDPDHYWGTHNLMAAYAVLDRLEDFLRMRMRYVRLRPNDPGAHFVLARELAYQRFDFELARHYQDRAQKLVRERGDIEADEDWVAWNLAWTEMFPALRMLAENQPEQARSAAAAIETQLPSLPEPLYSQVVIQLGYFYGTLGRPSKARELFAKVSDPMERLKLELDTDLWRDDRKGMERAAFRVYESGDRLNPVVATALARTGHWREAEQTLRSYEQRPNLRHLAVLLEGEIAAARGDYDKAEESLHSALEWMMPRNNSALYLTAETLARVYQERGRVLEAIRLLGEVGDRRRLINPRCGPYWLKTRFQLLDFYDAPEFEEERTDLKASLREFLGRETETKSVM